jgi:hypothetical protein
MGRLNELGYADTPPLTTLTHSHITGFMSIALRLRVLHTHTTLLPTLNVIARLIRVERLIALRLQVSHTCTLRTHI